MYRIIKKVTMPANTEISIEHGLTRKKPRMVIVNPYPNDPSRNAVISLVSCDEKNIRFKNNESEDVPVTIYIDSLHSYTTNYKNISDEVIFINAKSGLLNITKDVVIKYVDPNNGDDNNTGNTWETAWKTLSHALEEMPDKGNYYVYLASGVYNEEINFSKKGCADVFVLGSDRNINDDQTFRKAEIIGVDQANKTITVPGDIAKPLVHGQPVQIDDSTGNDGIYTVDGAGTYYDNVNDVSYIAFYEPLPSDIADGVFTNYVINPYDIDELDNPAGLPCLICKLPGSLSSDTADKCYVRINYEAWGVNYISDGKIVKLVEVDPDNYIYKLYIAISTTGTKLYSCSETGRSAYNIAPREINSIDIKHIGTIITGNTIKIDYKARGKYIVWHNVIFGNYTESNDNIYLYLYNNLLFTPATAMNHKIAILMPSKSTLPTISYYAQTIFSNLWDIDYYFWRSSINIITGRNTTLMLDNGTADFIITDKSGELKLYADGEVFIEGIFYKETDRMEIYRGKFNFEERFYCGGSLLVSCEEHGKEGLPTAIKFAGHYYNIFVTPVINAKSIVSFTEANPKYESILYIDKGCSLMTEYNLKIAGDTSLNPDGIIFANKFAKIFIGGTLYVNMSHNYTFNKDLFYIDNADMYINDVSIDIAGSTPENMFNIINNSKVTLNGGIINDLINSYVNGKAMFTIKDNSCLTLGNFDYDDGKGLYLENGGKYIQVINGDLIINDKVRLGASKSTGQPVASSERIMEFIDANVNIYGHLDFKSGDYGDPEDFILIDKNSKVVVHTKPTIAEAHATGYNMRIAVDETYVNKYCISLKRRSSLIIKDTNTSDGRIAYWTCQIDNEPNYQVFNFGSIGVNSNTATYPNGNMTDIDTVPGTSGTPGSHELVYVYCKLAT